MSNLRLTVAFQSTATLLGVRTKEDLRMQGVVYTGTANWQFSVCKELKQMGYNVDLNCLA